MRYVNTLPKRGSGRSLRAVTYLPTYHLPSRWNRTIPPLYLFQRAGRGVERGEKLMRLPTGRYRTPLSRASLAENVSRLGEKFGNLSGLPPRISESTRYTPVPYVSELWYLKYQVADELWCGVGGKRVTIKRYELINGLDA